ncbi:MAG: molybdenum ABC transporter ATP-binding protein [Alphaproteobacteria bacterium]|nr:molybdenum ABC transporter ATP-binding protein [Alphaproteobacteria bacterium]
MTIEVDVTHRLGAFVLDARFACAGGLTALFGRSGSGKTSLVDLVAGLIRPERGRVVVDGRVLVDTARGIFVPAHRRRVGYVFQEGRLFPHLTVRQNLLYGRWFTPSGERRGALGPVVDLLGIGPLLQRRPDRLSGGEKQRVAIGRALLASPRLLLMDEPLAALDAERKAEILPYIERLRDAAGVPIVYVSHAVAEVVRLATSVVLLSDGRVVASGGTAEIMGRPELFGLTGRADAGAVLDAVVEAHDPVFGLATLRTPAGPLVVPGAGLPPGGPVRVRIRARDVMLATRRPEAISALNVLDGSGDAVGEADGPTVDVRIGCRGATLVARVTRRSVAALALAPGVPVFAVVKSVAFDRPGAAD